MKEEKNMKRIHEYDLLTKLCLTDDLIEKESEFIFKYNLPNNELINIKINKNQLKENKLIKINGFGIPYNKEEEEDEEDNKNKIIEKRGDLYIYFEVKNNNDNKIELIDNREGLMIINSESCDILDLFD